jgi:glycosyltransferase involved in cell wall biosynthesis
VNSPHDRPFRIAFNALSLPLGKWGGGATFALNVLHHLCRIRADAEIVVYCREGESRLPDVPNLKRREMRVQNAGHRIGIELVALSRDLGRVDPDVFVSPNESLPLRIPCPVVVVAQNLAYHGQVLRFAGHDLRERSAARLQRAFYRRRMLDAFSRATAVVAVSEETKRTLVRESKLDAAKTTVILEGSDSILMPPPTGTSARSSTVLIVSTLAPYKNLERAVALFAALRRRHSELKLEIVGPDWRGFQRTLEAEIRAQGTEGAVRLRGQVDPERLAGIYEQSLLLLHLSECESFGLPLAEAMRYGLPAVAARRSSSPEVAGDGALLVEPDDFEGTVAALDELVTDEAARAALAARGLERARSLTWLAAAEGIAAVAESAAASTSDRRQ